MGAVLEMRRGIASALALAACLAGCGAAEEGASREERAYALVGRVQGLLALLGREDADIGTTREPGAGFTPEEIAANVGAYRLVQINALGLSEPARVIQANGDEITLELQSGPTAAFDGGILVATRGFGADLVTIESRGVVEALRAGGGTVSRRMETLDDQDQVHVASFSCTITAAGTETVNLGLREASLRRLDENCRSETLIFDNIYWLDASGNIVSSRQYVSPTVAYLRSSRL